MGFFDKVRHELIDIIEWTNEPGEILVHKFERHDNAIKMGAKLVVRPGQRAVFVDEGKVADTFDPGTYTLETDNIPILTTLRGWKYGFQSPFKAEVYFIDTTEQLDRKWGTQNPVMLRDADFGVVRLRCRGNYSYRTGTNKDLISRFVGGQSEFRRGDLESQVRAKVVSAFSDVLGELKIPALDLLAQYDEISLAMKKKMTAVFEELGLEILSFTLENIDVPEEVQKAMDQRSSMGAIGNMNQFSQYQAAQALRDAANNPGNTGNMMGMMVGGQLGGSLGHVLNQPGQQQAGGGAQQGGAQQGGAQNPQAPNGGVPSGSDMRCPNCKEKLPSDAMFCAACGEKLTTEEEKKCIKCKARVAPKAKFCSECGAPQRMTCPKCDAELNEGARFCSQCGSSL
jgi:membrane protease subunit (stomatin/prohibitin family)